MLRPGSYRLNVFWKLPWFGSNFPWELAFCFLTNISVLALNTLSKQLVTLEPPFPQAVSILFCLSFS